jgi:hypothetical protein
LFDLRNDPMERVNLLHQQRDVAARLNDAAAQAHPELAVTGWTVQQVADAAAKGDPEHAAGALRQAFAFKK